MSGIWYNIKHIKFKEKPIIFSLCYRLAFAFGIHIICVVDEHIFNKTNWKWKQTIYCSA